jgi:hypothetical protein
MIGLSTDDANNLSISQSGITTGSLNLNFDKLLIKGQAGTSGQVLTSGGPSGSISWGNAAGIGNLGTTVTGTNQLGNTTYSNINSVALTPLSTLPLSSSGVYILFASLSFILTDQIVDFYFSIQQGATILMEDQLYNQKNYSSASLSYSKNLTYLLVKSNSTSLNYTLHFSLQIRNGPKNFTGNWASVKFNSVRIK